MEKRRIETREEVNAYLARLRYLLNNKTGITIQLKRNVDEIKPIQNTNQFTVTDLFPDENPEEALKRELATLTVQEYLGTVKDTHFPKKSEMREFGKVYEGAKEVYIKFRVEILASANEPPLFVMSFHYAMIPFDKEVFPYKE